MTCEHLHELQSAYLDGELNETDATAVEKHLASCAACRTAIAEFEQLSQVLARGLMQPAADAAAAGAFDPLWDRIAAQLAADTVVEPSASVRGAAAPTTPGGLRGLFERLRAYWREQRGLWVPAFSAAAVLAVVVGLVVLRANDPTPLENRPRAVAVAPLDELPPFAAPRLTSPTAVADNAPQGSPAEPSGGQATRRRAPEGMVAASVGQNVQIVSYEVDRGTVLVESDPDAPNRPVIVWHFLPEDLPQPPDGNEEAI